MVYENNALTHNTPPTQSSKTDFKDLNPNLFN